VVIKAPPLPFPCRVPGWGSVEKGDMRSQSWLRRNWVWAAGGVFLGAHLLTWLLQRTMKNAVRSERALRDRSSQEDGPRSADT